MIVKRKPVFIKTIPLNSLESGVGEKVELQERTLYDLKPTKR